MNYNDMLKVLNNLSYCECYNCTNYFFVHEIPNGMNDPNYCPYCGINFESLDQVDIEGEQDEDLF